MAPRHPAPQPLYQVRLEGHLSLEWSDWFLGMAVTYEDEYTTTLTGPLVDQAELHGLLGRVRDLGLILLAVRRCDESRVDQV